MTYEQEELRRVVKMLKRELKATHWHPHERKELVKAVGIIKKEIVR